MMKNYFLFTVLLFFAGCYSNTVPDEVIHPVPERLPHDSKVNFTVDIEGASQTRDIPELNGDIHATIDKSISDTELFEVEDVVIDTDGYLYTRTRGSNSIEVYDFDGNHSYTIGREGRGPGEFTYLRAMDFDSSYELLYVLDMNEIEVYTRSEDGQFQPTNTIYHGLDLPTDICVLSDNIYISGLSLSTLDAPSDPDNPLSIFRPVNASIHSFNAGSGERTHSFGQTYQSYSGLPFLDANLSRTFLSCNDNSDTIVGLFVHYGYFFGYDVEGDLKWISRINNFKSMQIKEEGIHSPAPVYGGVANTIADSFYPFRETDLQLELIQINHHENELSTYYLDSATGELSYGGSSSTITVAKTQDVGATMTLHNDEYNSISIQTVEIE